MLILLLIPVGAAGAQAVSISPTSGPVGTKVSVTGTGFTANAAFSIYFAYGTSYQSIVDSGIVSSDGTASGSFNVPQVPYGSYTIRVQTSSVNRADVAFTVVPQISLSKVSARVGAQIVINGTGFTANKAVTITFDGSTIASTNTNSYGTFSASFNVPASTTGDHKVVARDGVHSKNINISVVQSIAVSPTHGTPGTTLTITGTGFLDHSIVTITFGGSIVTTIPARLTTNSLGSFSADINVPDGSSRNVQIVAKDATNSASVTFLVEAGILLNPTTEFIGAQVKVTGAGFGPEKQVNVLFDGSSVVKAKADSKGSFSASFNVPTSTGGQHTVTVTDGTNSASATLTVQTGLTVTPNKGEVGTQVTVSGSGFKANKATAIYFKNNQVASISTDANGSFVAKFPVPANPSGKHTVKASDGTYSGNSDFTILPSLALDPTGSHMGAQVTASGTGFTSGRAVNLSFGNTQVKTTTTDASGSFVVKFNVPQLEVGSYTVTANDGVNTVTASFTITTSFSIEPTTGHVGISVTIKGAGFQGSVTIKYDDGIVASTIADTSREIFATFSIPASIHGEHLITVSDTINSLQLVFTMESTPPSVPNLLDPKSGSRENTRPTLTWQAVTDPSGVTYSLQIAEDSAFTNILLQKEELTATQYTLTNTEKLNKTSKEAPYYWRVKAVDLASNQSQWSTPGSFYVSFMADWLKYTLIGLGATIGALIIFWLGVMTGRRWLTKEIY